MYIALDILSDATMGITKMNILIVTVIGINLCLWPNTNWEPTVTDDDIYLD